KALGQRPVRGRLPAVEQTGFGKIGNAGANAGNVRARSRLPLQPGQQRGVAGELAVKIEAAGGDDDNVGLFQLADRDLRRQRKGVGAVDGATVKGGDGDAKARVWPRTLEGIP